MTQRSTANNLLYSSSFPCMYVYMHYTCVFLCIIMNMLYIQFLQLAFFSDRDHYFSMLKNNLGKYDFNSYI